MSRNIVPALKPPVDRSFDLLSQFIEVCPDEIWAEKFGGWPVWQQIYHALTAVDFFITLPGQAPPPHLAEAAIGSLKKTGETPLPRPEVKAALAAAKARVDQFCDGLTDEDLPKRNEPLFAKAQFDLSLAGTLALLAAHNMYHLGAGDAALRQRGRPGVF